MINKVEAKYQIYCYEGLGKQIVWRFGENKEVINLILKGIDPEYIPFIEKGFREELEYTKDV